MNLKERQAWAYHVAKIGLVECVRRDEDGVGRVWHVPGRGNMGYCVEREDGVFGCQLQSTLGTEDCDEVGVCQHIMAVVMDEMLVRGRRAAFWESEAEADGQKRPKFEVVGDGGSLWVTHRKEGGG